MSLRNNYITYFYSRCLPNFTGIFCEQVLDMSEVTTTFEGSNVLNTARQIGHIGLVRVKTYVFWSIYIETFQ